MTREEFVAGIKVGDRLAADIRRLQIGRGMDRSKYGYQVVTVKHISPKRTKFVCEAAGWDNVTFDSNGQLVVGVGFHRHWARLEALSPEILESILADDKRQEVCRLVRGAINTLDISIDAVHRYSHKDLDRLKELVSPLLTFLQESPKVQDK